MSAENIVTELEAWFHQAEKPQMPIQLYPGVKIVDYDKFLDSQFSTIRGSLDPRTSEPALSRLRDLKALLLKAASGPEQDRPEGKNPGVDIP